jgi:type II pantothenate kinase
LIIGIDIGSTTTKAVSIENGEVTRYQTICLAPGKETRAQDAIAAATGVLGKIVYENGIDINNIKRIAITGVGSSKIKDNIFGIPTGRVDEIEAIGIGGMFLSGMKNIIITNIGTGTAIVEAGEHGIHHFGGSGIGGGTILGLSKKLLQTTEFSDILELAKTGKINQVDLLLSDITDTSISFLSGESTASNFGKMLDTAASSDIALAIINMVYQVIGVLSVFAARAKNSARVIVTGKGSKNLIGRNILFEISKMYGIEYVFPEHAEYTTAIGAGLA